MSVELPIDLPVDSSDVDAATKHIMAMEKELADLNKQIAGFKLPDKVGKARKELAALKVPPAAPLSRWDQALASVKSSLSERISAPEGSVGGILLGGIAGGLVVAGAGMVVGAIRSITSAMWDLGRSALDAAGHAERTDIAFRNLIGGDAEEYLGFLENLGQHSEFTGGELKSFGAELLRAGIKGEDFTRSMAAAMDIASRFEDPVRGMQTAIGALSQLELSGQISKGQLLAFGLNDDRFFGGLAKQMGVSLKTLKERMAQGKIDVKVLREALFTELTKSSGKDLGTMGVETSKSYLAQIKKLKDAPGNIFESLAKTEGFAKITAAVERLQVALNGETGEKLAAGLGKVIDKLGTWLQTVDVEKLAERISSAFGTILKIVEKVGAAIGFVVDHWEDLKRATGALPGVTQGKALVAGIQGGIEGSKSGVFGAVKGVAGGVIDTFKDMLDIRSPSRVFRQLGMMTAAGFSAGLMVSAPSVESSVEDAIAVPATAVAEGASAVGSAAQSIGSISLGGLSMTVQVSGGTNASPEALAQAIAIEVPSAIQAALERLAMELGRA